MSVENTVDIGQVPPDIDPAEVGVLKNPLKEDFVHTYDSKEQIVPSATEKEVVEEVEGKDGKVKKVKKTVLVEGRKQFPLTIAVALAKHLAEKIIRAEHRNQINLIKDEKLRYDESRKSIPSYGSKIWEKMKELVETDSDFFTKKNEKGEEKGMSGFIR